MPSVARFVTSAVVLATLVAAAVQPLHATPQPQADARVVCVNGAGGATSAPCTNADAYLTIQAAVDAAHSGDEIRIAKGVYVESDAPSDGNVVLIDQKSLKLVGGFDPSNWTTPGGASDTVIDGAELSRGIEVRGAGIAIEHLTIARGYAQQMDGSRHGGGLYVRTADQTITLLDVVLRDNVARGDGGGLYTLGGTTKVIRSQILNNTAQDGGGVYFSNVDQGVFEAIETHIRNNRASSSGGGIYGVGDRIGARTTSHPRVHLTTTVVAHNAADLAGGLFTNDLQAADSMIAHNTARYSGGIHTNTANIERTRIAHNRATGGSSGGLLFNAGSLTNVVIAHNTASDTGGGMLSYSTRTVTINNSLLFNNRAGIQGNGYYVGVPDPAVANVKLRNVTIASAEHTPHAAVEIEGGVVSLTNTAITNHAVGMAARHGAKIYGDYNAFSNNSVDHTVDGTAQPLPYANLVTANPQFVNPAASDFHLQSISPLIDAGDPTRTIENQRDIDGEAMPWGGRADIGADEVVGTPRVLAPLVAQY